MGPYELSTQRMTLERVLGVLGIFSAQPSEAGLFILAIPGALLQDIAIHVGQPLDVEFRARRNEAGEIAEGQVLAFQPMDSEGPQVFLDWLGAQGWADVDCVLCELGRACPEHPNLNED